MRGKVYQPMCSGCPHDLYYSGSIPQKQFGVMMHCGEHFCTGGKRARRFKRSDPKIRVHRLRGVAFYWGVREQVPCQGPHGRGGGQAPTPGLDGQGGQ